MESRQEQFEQQTAADVDALGQDMADLKYRTAAVLTQAQQEAGAFAKHVMAVVQQGQERMEVRIGNVEGVSEQVDHIAAP